MPSVTLPCPVCTTPLILDGENAGQDVICPDCSSRLKLPARIADGQKPEILAKGNAASTTKPQTADVPKGSLPQGRSKSAEEELKRLAGAAAAAGAAHSFEAGEAGLPANHHRTILPTKRNVQDAVSGETAKPAPAPAASSDALPGSRSSTALPTKRSPGNPLDPRSGVRPVEPIEVKPDVEMRATPLTGPSRFVRPEAPAVAPAPVPRKPPAEEASGDAESEETPVRGGFRLGGAARNPHFTPVQVATTDTETAQWGAAKAESPHEAARTRRLISLALLIVLLAAGGAGIYTMRQAFQAPKVTMDETTGQDAGEGQPKENVMANVEDAQRVLNRFLAADTVEKMAAEVRHPDITRPRMEAYYAANPPKPRKRRTESQTWRELRVGEKDFIRSAWELDDFRVYPFNLEIIAGGEPKIDWESFVNWSEMPWKDFLKTPPTEAVEFRVTVTYDSRDQYYNYAFKGREQDLMCFKLEDPEKYGSCWAYAGKDSEAASQLLFHLKRARRQRTVNEEGKIALTCILSLRFPPEGMKTNQVMVEKFVHDSWLQP